MSIISFRYSVISGLNPNELEPIYHYAARAILDGTAKTPSDVFNFLRQIYVDDAKFRQDFAAKEIQTSGNRKHLVKYILCKIESELAGHLIDYEADPATIEHILPENPTLAWEIFFPPERQEAFVYRLGNLSLLEAKANREVGNLPYPEKLPAYGTSNYHISRSIAERYPEEWNPATLQSRQQWLADKALRIWHVDF